MFSKFLIKTIPMFRYTTTRSFSNTKMLFEEEKNVTNRRRNIENLFKQIRAADKKEELLAKLEGSVLMMMDSFEETVESQKVDFDKCSDSERATRNKILKLKSQLKNAKQKLVENDGISALWFHTELLEATFLSSNPVPTSTAEYKIKLQAKIEELRKTTVGENESSSDYNRFVQSLDQELKIYIYWPKNFDSDLKDAMEKKVDKHFKIWIWLLCSSTIPEVEALRKEVKYDIFELRNLASGIAGLYIYSNSFVRELKNFKKTDLTKFALKKIQVSSIRTAATLLLKHTWNDTWKK